MIIYERCQESGRGGDKAISPQGRNGYKEGAGRPVGCTSYWVGGRCEGACQCATSRGRARRGGVSGGEDRLVGQVSRWSVGGTGGSWARAPVSRRRAVSRRRYGDGLRAGCCEGGRRNRWHRQRRPAQAPVATVRAWARVASRTKRATWPAKIRMSPRQVALALLAKPYQGERLRWRRAWPALRLSA